MSPSLFNYTFLLFLLFLLHSSQCIITARKTPRSYIPEPTTTIVTVRRNHTNTWHEFERFLDVGRGDQVTGMSELKKYFNRFGYLPLMHEEDSSNPNYTDTFDATFESAVNDYQAKLGLHVTGKLDFNTLSEIASPRCGVIDTVNVKKSMHATKNFVLFPGKPRWVRRIPIKLTYAFSPDYMINYLSLNQIRGVFNRSFARWASVIPVTFSEASDYSSADIKIGFYNGDHGDGVPFDGVFGVLAHAFSPESGKFHLDAAETWAVDFGADKSPGAIDLESVVTHEIGHVLGLGHSSVKESVMYPSLKPRHKKVDLKLDDIEGVQALYGSNPNFSTGSLLESDISSNQAVDFSVSTFNWATMSTMIILLLWLCII